MPERLEQALPQERLERLAAGPLEQDPRAPARPCCSATPLRAGAAAAGWRSGRSTRPSRTAAAATGARASSVPARPPRPESDRCRAAHDGPNPSRNVSRSSTVMARAAGTVSSKGLSRLRSTRRSASSGNSGPRDRRATARRRRPGAWLPPRRSAWSTRRCGRWRRAAAAPGRPAPACPRTSTCTSSPRATSATSPGT